MVNPNTSLFHHELVKNERSFITLIDRIDYHLSDFHTILSTRFRLSESTGGGMNDIHFYYLTLGTRFTID
jgi:hypothetical protein